MTPTFALCVLIYFGVTAIWDLLDRDAVTIRFGSNFRLFIAAAVQIAVIVLALVVLL